MDSTAMQAAFDDVFDHAVLFHGFTDYMRDYEIIIYLSSDPASGIPHEQRRLLFKYCVHATVETTLTNDTWKRSWDDRLINYDTGSELYETAPGYVWGVKSQDLYPGLKLISASPDADRWSRQLDRPFHQAEAHLNAQRVTLIFSDLEVLPVDVGYSPFQAPPLQTDILDDSGATSNRPPGASSS
jgi:hypothetical protein